MASEHAHELDDERVRSRLEDWLGDHLDGQGRVAITDVGRPSSGFSAETLVLTVSRNGRDEKLVLRKETPDPPVYPVQAQEPDAEIDIQYRAMEAVARSSSDVPLAPLVGYEADAGVVGAPFFVMGYVEGQVPIESPIYTKEGFFVDAGPEQRRALVEHGLRVLAAIHAIDWRAAGLDWLVPAGTSPTLERQLDVWESYARRELDGREHPAFERAVAWLRDNLPPERPPALCWGDPRPGNIIWRDFRPAAVTDWEAAAIAPAEVDLGWWLMFDRWSHETQGAPRLPGEPTREEQRDLYASFAGRDVGDTYFHEVFAATRYTAIVVRVMNRLVARGDLPADNTIWLDNPATVCLVDLME